MLMIPPGGKTMLQALDSYRRMTCYAATSVNDLELPALLTLLEEAWQADYRDRERITLDEAFLRWLMAEPVWVGLLVCTDEGQPVGFELALKRTLYCHQQPLQAYYNTLFTVSSQHRRRGLGRWMLHCINHLLFEERGADVVVAAFHPGHAGLPTVQSAHERLPGWGIKLFHAACIWGRRLDGHPLPAIEPPPAAIRIALQADAPYFTPLSSEGTPASWSLPTVAALTERLRTCHQVAFGLEGSFQTRYLRPGAPHAGTFWYDFGQGAQCSISFDMVALRRNEHCVGLLGRLQTVYAHHCAPEHLSRALHWLCCFFQDQGCCLVGLLDHGVIPHEVLRALSFRPTGEKRVFAVRGPQAAIRAFETVYPPYFIDL
jgi:GNAT superfamily N-acetyltransferase